MESYWANARNAGPPIKEKQINKPGVNVVNAPNLGRPKEPVPVSEPATGSGADYYLLNTSESVKELIRDLVKADVDAMLERDAVALIRAENKKSDSRLPDEDLDGPPPPHSISLAEKRGPGMTHWSYRAKAAQMVKSRTLSALSALSKRGGGNADKKMQVKRASTLNSSNRAKQPLKAAAAPAPVKRQDTNKPGTSRPRPANTGGAGGSIKPKL